MFNLIKMDVYRMLRSKALIVGAISSAIVSFLAILFGFAMVELFNFTLEFDPETASSMLANPYFPMLGWMGGVNLAETVLFGVNVLSLFIGCMITASFIGAEHSCGYTKNIAGQLKNRGYIVVSKFFAAMISQTIIVLIYTIVSIIASLLLLGKYIEGFSVAPLLGCLALKLLLYFAVNAVIVFICTLTKSHAIAMVIGAVLGSGVTKLIYMIANSVLSLVKIDINISHLMPDGVNGLINLSSLSEEAGRALGVSVVFIAVFVSLAALLYKKRDVK